MRFDGEWPLAGYEKIHERLELEEAEHRAWARVPWVVTEKIHGANFTLATDGDEIRCAKRKQYLAPGEDFFGHERVVARVEARVRALFARARREVPSLQLLWIHGELFGGGYPHPDVRPVEGVQPVQTGVWYGPDIELCAFDLRVMEQGEQPRYLDYEVAARWLAEEQLLFARPLLVGRYEEAAGFALGFATHVPGWLGLPPLPDNKAEGIVVKPWRMVRSEAAGERPIVKRKIVEFAEDDRYQRAQRWAAPGGRKKGGEISLLERLYREALARMNEARIDSAISKIGRIRRGDRRRQAEVAREVASDVIDALRAAEGADWERLPERERSELIARIGAAAGERVERRGGGGR